ncbi:hypothetical protein DPMN_191738 [Dreissena polymorpha]|uniref:Uncharacterized protein n=1 Tax=Dreissena polymorpha TaxID=45954 RepID=A0A9D3XZ34_DREPO|nr:hypothetical protein DPMN_191738 [Dreissena polymorpha]
MDIKQIGGDEKPFLTGLDFLPDGRLVAVDSWKCQCLIMNHQLQRLGTPYKFNTNPLDVVCLSQAELTVTMRNKAVCLLYVSPDNSISLTKKINIAIDVFSICCMTQTEMVVSTHNDARPMRMITKSGVVPGIDHLLFPSKTYQLEESRCTYIQSTNSLVLTDRLAHTLYINDKVKSRAITDDNIRQPRAACVGPGDTVLVCSAAKNSIVHVTVDGTILGSYKVDVRWPYTLCINKDRSRLVVSGCDIDMSKLLMYKLS